MKSFSSARFALVLLASGVTLSAQASLFGDNFDLDQGVVVNSANSGIVGSLKSVTVPGGASRLLLLDNEGNSASGLTSSSTSVQGGNLLVAADPGVVASVDAQYTFAAPKDFTGALGFGVDFLRLDAPDEIHVVGYDTAGRGFDAFVAIPASLVPFSVFVKGTFGGVDMTHIHELDLVLGGTNAPAGRGAQISGFQAVPEPSALASLGLGALALLRRKRK